MSIDCEGCVTCDNCGQNIYSGRGYTHPKDTRELCGPCYDEFDSYETTTWLDDDVVRCPSCGGDTSDVSYYEGSIERCANCGK